MAAVNQTGSPTTKPIRELKGRVHRATGTKCPAGPFLIVELWQGRWTRRSVKEAIGPVPVRCCWRAVTCLLGKHAGSAQQLALCFCWRGVAATLSSAPPAAAWAVRRQARCWSREPAGGAAVGATVGAGAGTMVEQGVEDNEAKVLPTPVLKPSQ